MLELTPGAWAQLAQESSAYYESRLINYEGVIQRYSHGMKAGQPFPDGDEKADYQNRAFGFVAQMAARFSAGDPQAAFSTTRTEPMVLLEAQAHELAVNRWARQAKLHALNEELAVDFSLWFAAVLMSAGSGSDANNGFTVEGWPRATRISPPRYLADTQAASKGGKRFEGDRVTVDKDDLLEFAKKHPKAGWDVRAIKAMSTDEGNSPHETRRESRRSAERNEITFVRLWVPEYHPEEKVVREAGVTLPKGSDPSEYNGCWIFVPAGSSALSTEEWIRRPMPFWGHPKGPYVTASGYIIPDELMGMSPVGAVSHQLAALEKMWSAIHESALEYARLLLVDAKAGDLAPTLAEGQHHHIIPVPLDNISQQTAVYEKGGVSAQQMAIAQMWSDLCDQAMGMGDAQRGVANDDTATANIFAQQNWGARTMHLVRKFQRMNADMFERASWWFYHQDDVEVPVPEMDDVYFGGGVEGMTWEDLDFKIDPQSLMRSGEDAERAEGQAMLELPTMLGPAMAQTPWVRWDAIVQAAADKLGMPRLAEAFDWEVLRAVQGMMLQQGLQPMQGPQQQPQPRLSRDAGMGAPGGNFTPRMRPGAQQGAPGGQGAGLTAGSEVGTVQ